MSAHRNQRNNLIDIHCHCIPGLDDGPKTVRDAIGLCNALAEDGIQSVIATPHQLGYFDGRYRSDAIFRGVGRLNEALVENSIPLRVFAGAEVRIDERIPSLLEKGEVLTLAESRYLLLELPHDVFLNPDPLIPHLLHRGIEPIIAHPERQKTVAASPELADSWLEKGAQLQITAGSLIGTFGALAEKAAWRWLTEGKAAFVATDAHGMQGTGKIPRMSAAIDAIEDRLGSEVVQAVCRDNPLCVLENRSITHVPATGGAKKR